MFQVMEEVALICRPIFPEVLSKTILLVVFVVAIIFVSFWLQVVCNPTAIAFSSPFDKISFVPGVIGPGVDS